MQKRHVLICEGSLCPRKQPDVSGPGLGEAGRYTKGRWQRVRGAHEEEHVEESLRDWVEERGDAPPRIASGRGRREGGGGLGLGFRLERVATGYLLMRKFI